MPQTFQDQVEPNAAAWRGVVIIEPSGLAREEVLHLPRIGLPVLARCTLGLSGSSVVRPAARLLFQRMIETIAACCPRRSLA